MEIPLHRPLSFHTREEEGESTNTYSMFIFAAHFDVGRAKDINNGGGQRAELFNNHDFGLPSQQHKKD